ncbi:MAG: hypothetical protein Q3M30_05950 [Candidatus Electrothrix sp. Rat3]|nr:hypothetical protein [Candidatus Electrothrix rattekaaiensis]
MDFWGKLFDGDYNTYIGIASFLLGLVALFFSKKNLTPKLSTKGKNSPNIVNGNYTLNEGKGEGDEK